MARSGWAASNNLRYAAAVVTATPLTMSIWCRTTSSATTQRVCGAWTSGSSADLNQFSLRLIVSQAIAQTGDGSSSNSAATASGLYSNNVWFCLTGVFASATSRAVFVNGRNKATQATSRVPSGIDRLSVGLRDNASNDEPFVGDLAHFAVWNTALSDGEVAKLGGTNAPPLDPRVVRREFLVHYSPIVGADPEPNLMNSSQQLSVVGSLTTSTSNRLVTPQIPKLYGF